VRIIRGHDLHIEALSSDGMNCVSFLSQAMPLLRPVVVVVPPAQHVQRPIGQTVVRDADCGERVLGMARHTVEYFVPAPRGDRWRRCQFRVARAR
jgi:hypothetical protein